MLDPDLDEHTIAPGILDLARAVWGLPSRLVITTNYDRVLERTCPTACPARSVIASPGGMAAMLAGRLERRTVWHLHGHLDDPTRLVLDAGSYPRLYADQEPMWRAAHDAFRQLVTGHTLLFVGFSLEDPGVTGVLGRVAGLYEGASRKHYVLCREDQAAKARKLGVEPVLFPDWGAPLVARMRELATSGAPCAGPVRPPRAGTTWADAAAGSALWAPDAGIWRDEALRIVQRCGAEPSEDPWIDPDFPLRTLSRLETLLDGIHPSPPEVAALIAAPFVHDALWSRAATWILEEARPDELDPSASPAPPRIELEQMHTGRTHPCSVGR